MLSVPQSVQENSEARPNYPGMPVLDDLADHTGGKSPLAETGERSMARS